jgi:excalibur calcium-binding domain-containing protein/uncharacterized protein DUF1524
VTGSPVDKPIMTAAKRLSGASRSAATLLVAAGLLASAGCGVAEAARQTGYARTGQEYIPTDRPSVSPTARPYRPAQRPSAAGRPHRPTPAAAGSAAAGSAAAVLASLPVKGRAPMTGYSRERFGAAWFDEDRNGCDTRDDVLARDLVHAQRRPGSSCVLVAGDLADPYTRQRIRFVRGDGDLVDIDHVVALGNAWATGAFRWPPSKRLALANDRANLLAVDASANRSKGDADAATWLPPNKAFRCGYVARQVSVKARYGLWVTPAERSAIARVLARCPGERASGSVPTPQPPPPSSSEVTTAPPSPSAESSPAYVNCDAARAAGAAPVHRGDPGYAAHLDRDGDGTGCE